jgi:YegS/Rv2252/BmrU family lipid kinase
MPAPIPVLVNPAAGGGRSLRAVDPVRAMLAEGGRTPEIVVSTGAGHLAEAAAAASRRGLPHVIALGGDGTLSEVASGLLAEGSTRTALAPVPVGTGNDFVKAAGVPQDWRAACRRILAGGEPRIVDAGRVDGRWFINGVGIGLDAAVAVGADRFKRRFGVLGYLAGFAGTLWRGPAGPRTRLCWDEGEDVRPMSLVTVCNGRYVGGLFHIAPEARLDDGLLSLVWAEAVGRIEVLRYVPRVIRGTHLALPIARSASVTRVEIEADAPLPVQADGEIISFGSTRLSVEIVPGALAVLC